VAWTAPVLQRIGTAPIPWKSVGLTWTNDVLQDVPQRVRVIIVNRPDLHSII
jgi:hypothetical protein